MKKYIKPAVVFPALLGSVVAALLLTLGHADDAPGLGGIGLVAGFLLTMRGVHNAGIVRKGFFLPVILLCFGAGGVVFSAVLQLDGELEEWPFFAPFGIAFGVALIFIGAVKLRKGLSDNKADDRT